MNIKQLNENLKLLLNEDIKIETNNSAVENGWRLEEIWGSGTLAAVYDVPNTNISINVYATWEADDPTNIEEYDAFGIDVFKNSKDDYDEYSDREYKDGAPTMNDIRQACKNSGFLTDEQIASIADFPANFHRLQMEWVQLLEMGLSAKQIKAVKPELFKKVYKYYNI